MQLHTNMAAIILSLNCLLGTDAHVGPDVLTSSCTKLTPAAHNTQDLIIPDIHTVPDSYDVVVVVIYHSELSLNFPHLFPVISFFVCSALSS